MKTNINISDYDIEDVLDDNGMLSKVKSLNFIPRSSQIEMAKLIRDAYETSSNAIIEAGTGTGKSFAYLAIALLHAIKNEEKTIIATSTKILQRQLFDKDIPLLIKAFGLEGEIQYTLLLGRVNYLCPKRLQYYKDSEDKKDLLGLRRVERFNNWVATTETGILDDYEGTLPANLTRADICSDGELCTSFKCNYFKNGECFYYKSRNKATSSQLVVTNQHLLLIDAMSRAECDEDYSSEHYLPSFNRLIIDEAQNTEGIATDVFTSSYSSFEVNLIIAKLTQKNINYDNSSLIEYVADFSHNSKLAQNVLSNKTILEMKMKELDDSLKESFFDKDSYRIRQNEMQYLGPLLIIAKDIIKVGNSIILDLNAIYNAVPEDKSEELALSLFSKHRNMLVELIQQLETFTDYDNWSDDVYYYERTKERDKTEKQFLSIAPLSVSSYLYNCLYSKLRTTIFTSATLSVNNSFGFFQKQMGLYYSEDKIISEIFPSSFHLESNMLMLAPKDLIAYAGGGERENREAYSNLVAPIIEGAINASGGGTLVLFTSNYMLNEVYKNISEDLKEAYHVLVQNSFSNKKILLNEFRDNVDSVLFGVSSFWEGVDIPGDSLRQVIIVQLPFESPNPIYDARCDLYKQLYGNSFNTLTLPSMIIKLKQGIGRLIRKESDRGVVLILDGKVNKNYGRTIFNSLSEAQLDREVALKEIDKRIDSFLNR